jgi:hypothetical protein
MHGCRIFYQGVRDYARADENSDFLTGMPIWDRKFAELESDDDGNWFNTPADDYLTFLLIADRATKSVQVASQERAIFRLYSLGISTDRDEWLYDRERRHLAEKIGCLITEYDRVPPTAGEFPDGMKWSRNLKRRLRRKQREQFDLARMVETSYRPCTARWLYQSDLFTDEAGSSAQMFPTGHSNGAICFSDVGSRTDYCVLAISGIADLHFGAGVDAYQQVPRFRFTGSERIDNITDWALDGFRSHEVRLWTCGYRGSDDNLTVAGALRHGKGEKVVGDALRWRQICPILAGEGAGAQPGAHDAGVDQVRTHSGFGDFAGVDFDQHFKAGLADRVGPPIRKDAARNRGCDEDRAPGRGGAQQRVHRPDQPPVRGQIEVHYLGPDRRVDMAERREGAELGRIADEDVEPAPAVEEGRGQFVDLDEIAQVDGDEGGTAAGGANRVVDLL